MPCNNKVYQLQQVTRVQIPHPSNTINLYYYRKRKFEYSVVTGGGININKVLRLLMGSYKNMKSEGNHTATRLIFFDKTHKHRST